MTHTDYEELVASYALGAPEGDEHSLIDHLIACESCRKLLGEFREVGGDLALVAEPIAPRAELEEALMRAVRGEARNTHDATPAHRTGRATRIALVAACVAALALGGLSASLYASHRHDRQLQQAVGAIINDPIATRLDLCARTTARCNLTVLPDGNGVLVAADLPPLTRGRVYELWLLQNGTATPAKVFARAQEQQWLLFKVAPGPYDHAAITVEHGPNGAQHPTGAMVYVGAMTA